MSRACRVAVGLAVLLSGCALHVHFHAGDKPEMIVEVGNDEVAERQEDVSGDDRARDPWSFMEPGTDR